MDVDEDEVEAIIEQDCWQSVLLQVTVPIHASDGQPEVTSVEVDLERRNYKFDATWFTSHFHNLEGLWEKQVRLYFTYLQLILTKMSFL